MSASDDMLARVAEAGSFGVLLRAIEAAGLSEVLTYEGPYTLFAPADEAFAQFADGRLEGLFADPEGELTPLVLYHLAHGRFRLADIAEGLEVETREGGNLRLGLSDGRPCVNGIHITSGDIEASNGIVHVIAEVLPVPVESLDWDDCEKEAAT